MVEGKQVYKQLPLNFAARNYMRREDFMSAPCNQEALAMIDQWPKWLSCGLYIYGPKGCGKSHLAHIFLDKVQAQYRATICEATAITSHNWQKLAQKYDCVVVENISPQADEEALFHLFNVYDAPNRYMLWTADKAPNRMNFKLPDLKSRLGILPRVAIEEPDDLMLQTLIVKLFDDRQLLISPEILQYILNNCRRSFAYIQSLIAEIDQIAWSGQCRVNYQVVKDAMAVIEEREDKQTDLFDER